MTADHARLLASIGSALGGAAPYEDAEGRAVIAGVVEDDGAGPLRTAWVEETLDRRDGRYDHEISLNVAGGGLDRVSVGLYHYNPYFGTDVHLLRFFGDSVVVVYHEKHHEYVVSLTPASPRQRGGRIGDDFVINDDLLVHVGSHEDLLHHLILPGVAPEVPLPLPPVAGRVRKTGLAVEDGPDGTLVRCAELDLEGPPGAARWTEQRVDRLRLPTAAQRGLPSDPPTVWARLRSLLDDSAAPADGADILIATAGLPFWRACDTLSTQRSGLTWWFVAVYHQFLRADVDAGGAGRPDEAARWLAWLDRLAAADDGEPVGWDASWDAVEGAARLALAHMRTCATQLVRACRAVDIPRYPVPSSWSKDDAQRHVPFDQLPEGFVRAWDQVPLDHFVTRS